MPKLIVWLWFSLVIVISAPAAEIFPTNSVWGFRKGTSEASAPASAWRLADFDDAVAGFSDAPAPFGYGEPLPGGTQLADMQGAYSCIYLRRPFAIGNAAQVASLRLRAFVDDGFVAWINGVEVARTNVAAVEPTYQTLAENAAEPPSFATYNLPAPSGYLVTGTNVLVVQVFNTSLDSSDFGFDGLLDVTITETPAVAPVIVDVSPPPGTLNALTSIIVTFSEPVAGLTADDFLINSIPVSTLTTSGNTFTFSFAQPPDGTLFINWADGHGITDLATPPNAFNADAPGASWQYTLVDTVPPEVAGVHPPAGLTVASLSQIEVTFSEAVRGVEASDLLINGQPATDLTFNGGAYLFRFPAPSPGMVNIAWAAGHGITDLAGAPHAFAGGSWNYRFEPGAPLPDLLINEFLAANVGTNGLVDEDGDSQDWIEIHNRGTTAVNLEGWSLSDDPALPGLWTFPARTLAPNAYLVVFASGKDRRPAPPGSPPHTNFKLGIDGEHLALYTPDSPRVLKHGFTPYPEQRNDISYGYDPDDTERYFAIPTPGAPNGVSTLVGVCAPVQANVNRGHFANPFDLVLSCATPDVTLRYTVDGSEPTADSAVFPGSLRIASTTLFRAAAFRTDYLPSKTITHSYFFNLSPALRSLPVVSIVTSRQHLYGRSGILGIQGGTYSNGPWQPTGPNDFHNPSQHGLAWERPASVEWIEPGDHSGFQVDCGIRVQGSDYNRPRLTPSSKFSFRLYFRNDYGPGRLEYPLFPLTSTKRFDQLVLRAGFNEQGNPFIRDELHRRLSRDMGSIASHGTLAVVFVNGVHYSDSPWYNPCERVHEEFFQEHLGGGEDWDVVSPSFAQSADAPGVVDGDRVDFENLVAYVNTAAVPQPAVYATIARRLDLTNFVDYCLLNAYAAMGDWPANNWRAGRDRGTNGLWRFVVWDAEWGMGIYNRSVTINTFTQTGPGPHDSGLGSVDSSEIARLYNRLRASPEFRLLWADRVHRHFFNGGVLTRGWIAARFNQLRDQLMPLIPNMNTTILNWARDRQPIFFSQMQPYGLVASSNAPGFSRFGGRVPAGFSLVMTNLAGTIYYTTDGSDPRTAFTGAVAPSARTYAGPLTLDQTVTVRARSLSGGDWSALTEAAFTADSLGIPLRISEIMYNPPGGSLHEFLELQNTSPSSVELGGMYFDGINFIFNQNTSLAGGARLVLGANTDTNAWKTQYPGVTPAGWFGGSLNNAGERISLFDPAGNLITFVEYGDAGGWPAADGNGRSLEVLDVNGDPNDPANWQASGSSPGAPNSAPPVTSVYLNELMAENPGAVNHAGTFPDWVELRNPGATPVSLAGWSLSDSGDARKYVFPAVTIPAFGHLVVWCDAATNVTPGLHTGFALAREGESVFLYDAQTNRVDAVSFGRQIADYSLGRIEGQWTLTLPTPEAANVAAPLASAAHLAINEWLADPLPGGSDWVELFNRSDSLPVSLHGLYLGTGSRLHQLAARSFLPPLGHLQLYADETVGADRLSFKLPGSGDSIILHDATGEEVERVTYGPQIEGVSQGRLPDGGSDLVSFPGSASPGAANYTQTYTGPVINEVLARNQSVSVDGQVADFVEIRNPGAAGFDLAGMSLSVDSPQPGRWVFPTPTLLGPGGHLLVRCDSASPVSTLAGSFNLGDSLKGESGGVYLFNPSGQLVDSVEYGFQVEDLSIGLSGGEWRLLSAPTPGGANAPPAVLGAHTALRVNEWMPAPLDGDDWFEIYNSTSRPVDLGAISLTDDPSLAGRDKFRPAPLSFIGPNDFVPWIAGSSPGLGRNHVNFALSAAGESLVIYGVNEGSYIPVDAVGFGAHPAGVSRGRLPDGTDNISDFPGSPTPGASNYRLLQSVVISEVLTHTDPPLEDAIELHNPTDLPVSVNGWYLSNNRNALRKYQITRPAPIPPHGYAVFYQNQFDSGANAFGLNSVHGDELWLVATAGGVETGERAAASFGAALNGVSFGRVETSQGVDFWPLTARTFGVDSPASLAQFRAGEGLPNAAPAIGPVIINEILYHPPGSLDGREEFIELHNNSAGLVALYDPAFPANCWKLGGGVSFTFPPGVGLAAGASLLVVNFNPADAAALTAFRARYGIDPSVPVYGPFSGALANDTDTVVLYRPDTPQPPTAPDAGYVPYGVVDRVRYTDDPPWPAGDVDGGGFSLQRLAVNLYGNEPLNWTGAAPTPGTANTYPALDTDGDGIPDWAENLLGLNRNDPNDAAWDSDADGLTNLQEYLAGTDPLDSDSFLKFDRVAIDATVTLTFRAAANKTYSLLCKNAMTDTDWTKLLDVPAAPVSEMKTLVDASANQSVRYYRLVTPALPP